MMLAIYNVRVYESLGSFHMLYNFYSISIFLLCLNEYQAICLRFLNHYIAITKRLYIAHYRSHDNHIIILTNHDGRAVVLCTQKLYCMQKQLLQLLQLLCYCATVLMCYQLRSTSYCLRSTVYCMLLLAYCLYDACTALPNYFYKNPESCRPAPVRQAARRHQHGRRPPTTYQARLQAVAFAVPQHPPEITVALLYSQSV